MNPRALARRCLAGLLLLGAMVGGRAASAESVAVRPFVSQHCVRCHGGQDPKGGLILDGRTEDVAAHPAVWEKVVRKLATRQMPPAGRPRPDEKTYDAIV